MLTISDRSAVTASRIDQDLRELIRHISRANPAWGSPRIVGELPLEFAEHRYTQPAREPKMDIGLNAFWQGADPLPPIDGTPGPAAVPAVLIKKQGDYPPFWGRDNSFIQAMEEIYARVVVAKNKDCL